jgi:hypothetical protein
VDAADARGGFGRDAKATREPPRAVIRAVSAKTSRARAQTARGNPDGTRAESHAPRAPIRRREPTAGRGQWSSGRAPTPLPRVSDAQGSPARLPTPVGPVRLRPFSGRAGPRHGGHVTNGGMSRPEG